MKLSGKGLCTAVSGSLLFACALSEVVAGLRCVSLGSAVRARFHLGAAAGAFYSGLLVGLGQVLLGAALLWRADKPACRNFFLLGVVVFLLGVLTAFSGAVVDGDAASLVGRKFSHYCFHPAGLSRACARLRDYQRSLLVSAVLCTLQCVLGLLHLLAIKRYKAELFSRSRRCQGPRAGPILLSQERDGPSAPFQPVSYISLGGFAVVDEAGAEVQSGGHPSMELPGYASRDPERNRCFPFSFPLPSELPPAYEDISPLQACNT